MNETSNENLEPKKSRELQLLEARIARLPKNGLGLLFSGGETFFRGVSYLFRNPRYIPLVILPLILNLILYIWLASLAFEYYDAFHQQFFAESAGEGWLDTVKNWLLVGGGFIAKIIFWILVAVIWYFTFAIVGSAIAEPFSDYLSECIEGNYLPELAIQWAGWKDFIFTLIGNAVRGILHTILRKIFLVTMAVVLIPLWLVPVVGFFVYALIMKFFIVWDLVWDSMDYCLARRKMSFMEKWRFYFRYKYRIFGFGLLIFFLVLVPFALIFVVTLRAAGGTVLYCEIVKQTGDTGKPDVTLSNQSVEPV